MHYLLECEGTRAPEVQARHSDPATPPGPNAHLSGKSRWFGMPQQTTSKARAQTQNPVYSGHEAGGGSPKRGSGRKG